MCEVVLVASCVWGSYKTLLSIIQHLLINDTLWTVQKHCRHHAYNITNAYTTSNLLSQIVSGQQVRLLHTYAQGSVWTSQTMFGQYLAIEQYY